jgi:hypothetical protein
MPLIKSASAATHGHGQSIIQNIFPSLEWKCIPQKFSEKNMNVVWDGQCSSMIHPGQEAWRLTIAANKWTKSVGEKISGEILFIKNAEASLLNMNREVFHQTWGNQISTFLVGGFSKIKLKSTAKVGEMTIYGIGLGVGLQSHKNLNVRFRRLPNSHVLVAATGNRRISQK